jgi:hypothetical protein
VDSNAAATFLAKVRNNPALLVFAGYVLGITVSYLVLRPKDTEWHRPATPAPPPGSLQIRTDRPWGDPDEVTRRLTGYRPYHFDPTPDDTLNSHPYPAVKSYPCACENCSEPAAHVKAADVD